MGNGQDRVVRFSGRGASYTAALESVTANIISGILCGTFSREQLNRIRMTITKRIGKELNGNHPNTGQKVQTAKP